MALIVVSRRYRSLWLLGLEISIRSDYQFERIKFTRRGTFVQPSHDGDAIGTQIASSGFVDTACLLVDRIGAVLFPRCATHRDMRVALIQNRHQCAKCREELGLS